MALVWDARNLGLEKSMLCDCYYYTEPPEVPGKPCGMAMLPCENHGEYAAYMMPDVEPERQALRDRAKSALERYRSQF